MTIVRVAWGVDLFHILKLNDCGWPSIIYVILMAAWKISFDE